jgi:nitric oxide reductase subunit C
MRTNLGIFLLLTMLFLSFTALLYLQPLYAERGHSAAGAAGKIVWQKYNCQSCHQIYGLGGYLGPDLTNVVSQKGKGDAYVLGLIKGGTQQMPVFSLTGEEQKLLLDFLHAADESGKADPRSFNASISGMIRKK